VVAFLGCGVEVAAVVVPAALRAGNHGIVDGVGDEGGTGVLELHLLVSACAQAGELGVAVVEDDVGEAATCATGHGLDHAHVAESVHGVALGIVVGRVAGHGHAALPELDVALDDLAVGAAEVGGGVEGVCTLEEDLARLVAILVRNLGLYGACGLGSPEGVLNLLLCLLLMLRLRIGLAVCPAQPPQDGGGEQAGDDTAPAKHTAIHYWRGLLLPALVLELAVAP